MKRKIRVLYTISNFDTAGSGKVLYDLAKNLDKDKFEVEIACSHANGSFFNTVEALGMPIHIFNTKTTYRPYYTLPFRILKIARFFKKNKYDLIHSWQWSSDWTEAMAAKLAACKWIYTKKAMGFKSRHWKIKSNLADFIITINKDMALYFKHKKNQCLIPLGIDTEYYSSEKKNDDDRLHFKIITVANLVKVKGVELLINAVAELRDPYVQLTIIGSGDCEYIAYLKKLTKELGVEDTTLFLGRKDDVRPYLSQSNLFVIPTLDEGRREGMPMALVEAMSIGIPVLGSNVSGIKYVLKDFPDHLFNPSSVDMLTRKIENLRGMTLDDRNHLGMKLRAYVMEHFNMPKFIKAHQELYQSIVND